MEQKKNKKKRFGTAKFDNDPFKQHRIDTCKNHIIPLAIKQMPTSSIT